MEVIGTVAPSEVPAVAPMPGRWTNLARQAIAAHQKGQVLVVKVKDRAEYKRMVNGMSDAFRRAGYGRSFSAIDEQDGSVRCYLQLNDSPRHTKSAQNSVVVGPIGRGRKTARG